MRRFTLLLAAVALTAAPALADSPPRDWRGQVRAFNAEHCKHPAWGTSHSKRDYHLAKAMAAADKVAIDDDVLDWLGAIGAARIMALADPNGAQPDGPAVLPMLKENLRDVPARVLFPAGKALMPAKREALAKWLEMLSAETDGFKVL